MNQLLAPYITAKSAVSNNPRYRNRLKFRWVSGIVAGYRKISCLKVVLYMMFGDSICGTLSIAQLRAIDIVRSNEIRLDLYREHDEFIITS